MTTNGCTVLGCTWCYIQISMVNETGPGWWWKMELP